MDMKCEIVGWVLLDDSARVLVRDESGRISRQGVDPKGTFAHQAIQTGSFHRNQFVVPETNELGYDLECLPSPGVTSV